MFGSKENQIQVFLAIQKFVLHHLALDERYILVTSFANQKKSKEGFHFYEKNTKQHSTIVWQRAVTQEARTQTAGAAAFTVC